MRRSELFAVLLFAGISSATLSVAAQPQPAQPPAAAAPKAPPAQPPAAAAPKAPAAQPPAAAPPGAAPAPGAPAAGAPPSTGALPPGAPQAPVQQQPAQAPPTTQPPVAPAALPPEPPASAPSPVQPMPMVPPLSTPATTPTTLTDEGPEEDDRRLAPPESSIGPEIFAGVSGRLSDAEGFRDDDEHTGVAFGLGGWFAPNRTYSLGLTYQRTTLGTAQTAGGENSLSARYDLNTFWFGGRAYPLRDDRIGLYILLELGASWQEVSAGGTRSTGSFTSPAGTYSCSEADSPGLALGGGLGLDVELERELAFVVQTDLSGHRLSSEVIDGCARGIGSATNLAARVGFLYRFDLDQSVQQPLQRVGRRSPNRF